MSAYLDHNATAPLRPEAREAMLAAWLRFGNPSSAHLYGRAARKIIEDGRAVIAFFVGMAADEVIFTSGGTEANDLAINGSGRTRILAAATEHASVLKAHDRVESIPVDENGIIRLDVLRKALASDSRPTMVCLMLANNETGVIQPVGEAAQIAHAHGAWLHCDAVQAAGKTPLISDALNADSISLSAHKLGGPQGIGALIVRSGLALTPRLRGGGQEGGRRSGTEPVALIAGFAAAAQAAKRELRSFGELAMLRDSIESKLVKIRPDIISIGAAAMRLPNTACLAIPSLTNDMLVAALDLEGVAIGAGAACASGKSSPSHVLTAMGVSPDTARSTIRISLGWSSSAADIETFLRAFTKVVER
jgi:cysteine desulfurase